MQYFFKANTPSKSKITKGILMLIFVLFCNNISAQSSPPMANRNFEGTYTTSDFTIVLIKNGSDTYDGEITYKNKKQVFQSSSTYVSAGNWMVNIFNNSGGFWGNNRQLASLKKLSNGDVIWKNSSFSGMPNEVLLKRVRNM